MPATSTFLADDYPIVHPTRVWRSDRRGQFSPLRYPGGKSWLVPLALRWLSLRPHKVLLEPFAGGASVGLALAASGLVRKVALVEMDEEVALFWRVVLTQPRQLATLVRGLPATERALIDVLSGEPRLEVEAGFQTLVRNRVARGGVLAAGAGILKSGEAGRGILSRWYPETLAERIERIGAMAERIELVEGDGLAVWGERLDDPETAVFADPPYTVEANGAGHRLYTHSEIDHSRLLALASKTAGDVLVSYPVGGAGADRASRRGLNVQIVNMAGTRGVVQRELLLGRDLAWMDELLVGPDASIGLRVAERRVAVVPTAAADKHGMASADVPSRGAATSDAAAEGEPGWRRAVADRLGSRPQDSDRLIARDVGVSARSVRELRRRIAQEDPAAAADRRLGADGRERPLPGVAVSRVVTHLTQCPDAREMSDRALAVHLAVSRASVALGRRRWGGR